MREGLIPTILGTGVTAAGIALKTMTIKKNMKQHVMEDMVPMIACGIIGFGLAHVLLGTIDLFEDR